MRSNTTPYSRDEYFSDHYITWLLEHCTQEDQRLEDLITDEAMALLVDRLSTPLQIEYYLARAFEEGYRAGQKPITPEVINTALVNDLDDLEPRLTGRVYQPWKRRDKPVRCRE